jgi:hypothetical protein
VSGFSRTPGSNARDRQSPPLLAVRDNHETIGTYVGQPPPS